MRILLNKENLSQDALKSAILAKYPSSKDISFEVKDSVLVAISLTSPASEAQIKEVVESLEKSAFVPEPEVANTPVLESVASEDLSAAEVKELIASNRVVKDFSALMTKDFRKELNALKSEADVNQDEIIAELKNLSQKNVDAITSVEKRLENADSRTTNAEKVNSALAKRLDEFDSRLTTLANSVASLKGAMDAFMAKFGNLKVELKYGDGK